MNETTKMITIDDVNFIIEEVFADFYENALGKNSSGEYDEDVKKLDIAEQRLWDTLQFIEDDFIVQYREDM
tara:strand:- start:116 stop:328 length:213 start_codon:yes stop_codon:yes gene_type:complete